MKLSIIIPTYNEAAFIGKLVNYLLQNGGSINADIIVSDAGSNDDTMKTAQDAGARAVLAPAKGRGAQMNYAAGIAKGDVLYFIHADCFPPASFIKDIEKAIKDGFDLGRYSTKFDSHKTILKLNAWLTRFDFFLCMGGDQTLFIKKDLFERCNGFREDMKIMEEFEFCRRARMTGKYKILKGAALISARKYDTNSWLKVQRANAKIARMYKKGASQQEMLDTYKRMLSYRKSAFEKE